MIITYKNNKIEKICSIEKEMREYFSQDEEIIISFRQLFTFLERFDNVFEFYQQAFKGYKLEKLVNDVENRYSLRIVPKRRKCKYRLLFTIENNGIQIEIQKISNYYEKR